MPERRRQHAIAPGYRIQLQKIADYLVEKGAKTNIRNRKGRTPFEMEAADPDAKAKKLATQSVQAVAAEIKRDPWS